jgi:cytochrome P450
VNGLGGGDLARVDQANREMFALFDEIVAEREAALAAGAGLPEDVIGVLTRAKADGLVSHGELRRLCQQLLVAGHETTASLISLMLYRLIQHPELVEQLRSDPGLVPSAVEEFLRFDSPVQGLFRVNEVDCPVRGHVLPAGTKLQALFASANRDPEVWEAPDSGSTAMGRAAGRTSRSAGGSTTASARRSRAARASSPCGGWSSGSSTSSSSARWR